MVKDILREIKRKLFQFFAIALITALGVGFFVGIQVTGYNMRLTGDIYTEEANILDLQMLHTLGFDEAMIEEIRDLTDVEVAGVKNFDAFTKSEHLDDVLHIIELDSYTEKDLTLIEGRLPKDDLEIVVDHQLFLQEKVNLGDTIRVVGNDIIEDHTSVVVGFVDSSLYLNLERGQTRLGSGSLAGFAYAVGTPYKEDIMISVRIISDHPEETKALIKDHEQELIDHRFGRIIAPKIVELEDAQIELDQARVDAQNEFASQWQRIVRSQNELEDKKQEVSLGIAEIASMSFEGSLSEQLSAAKANSKEVLDLAIAELKTQREKALLLPPEHQAPALAQIDAGIAEVEANRVVLDGAYKKMDEAIGLISEGEVQLSNARSSYYSAKWEVDAELAANQKKIDDGYVKIDETSHGSMFIMNRSESIIGYDDFYQDSERIEGIGKVFPLIFFGVAILVTLSTVSRMVDESRMQIGVYKALGYSWIWTSMKFVGFTLLSWLLGSIVGLIIGFYLIPVLIYDAYRIMYLTPALEAGFVWSYAIVPLVLSFVSSVGVALYKSQSVSRETAALLMVPPVPKGGQRIILERVGFLWKRLSFLYKVSLRNLFRNKSRFLMTIVGIGGCCGLLLTGFGLKHSIYSIVDKQFDEIINYDGVVAFQHDWDDEGMFVDRAMLHSDNVSVNGLDVSIYAADSVSDLSRLIHMKDYESGEDVVIGNNTVVLTQKLANYNGLSIGDEFEVLRDSKVYTFTVGEIVENYIAHYIYIDQGYYESQIEEVVDSNLVLFQYAGDTDLLTSNLLQDDDVLSVNVLGNLKTNYLKMMGNFDIVILVIVGAAFALELIVLLNLITMNMSERSKELATLKVLGFYPKELSSYIMRENIILTVLSLGVGLIFGRYLHQFVIVSAEINMVSFNKEILWSTYALAVSLTFGMSVLINLLMARHANKVNMAEALKM